MRPQTLINELRRRLTSPGATKTAGYGYLLDALLPATKLSSNPLLALNPACEVMENDAAFAFVTSSQRPATALCRTFSIATFTSGEMVRIRNSSRVSRLLEATAPPNVAVCETVLAQALRASVRIATMEQACALLHRLLETIWNNREFKHYTDNELHIIITGISLPLLFADYHLLERYVSGNKAKVLLKDVVELLCCRYSSHPRVGCLELYLLRLRDLTSSERLLKKAVTHHSYEYRFSAFVSYFREVSVMKYNEDFVPFICELAPYVEELVVPRFMHAVPTAAVSNLSTIYGHLLEHPLPWTKPDYKIKLKSLVCKMWRTGASGGDLSQRWVINRLSILSKSNIIELRPNEVEDILSSVRSLCCTSSSVAALRGIRSLVINGHLTSEQATEALETLTRLMLQGTISTKCAGLRQLGDSRLPPVPNIARLTCESALRSKDVHELALVAPIVSYHAPPEQATAMLRALCEAFNHAILFIEYNSVSSFFNFYTIVLKNNLSSRLFFQQASEMNRCLIGLNEHFANELATTLMYAIPAVEAIRNLPLAVRTKEAREFTNSTIDIIIKCVMNDRFFPSTVFRRVLTVLGHISLTGAPGRNTNQLIRPVLQHVIDNHTLTGESISSFVRSLLVVFQSARGISEKRKLIPLVNLCCSLIMENRDLIQPRTCSFFITLLSRRGNLEPEQGSRLHIETFNVCSNILFQGKHSKEIKETLLFSRTPFTEEILPRLSLMDIEAKDIFFREILKFDNVLYDTRSLSRLTWSMARTEHLWLQ